VTSGCYNTILLALYLFPIFYIFEKRVKTLEIPVSVLSFIDNGLLISWKKSLLISNSNPFCNYYVMSHLLEQFGLFIEQGKTENFHFSRSHGIFDPLPLDFSTLGGPVLQSKENWKYLSFIFNRKLSFHLHIDFYMNKAISTVKSTKMLGNLSRGLILSQRCLLYRLCILPIALYRFIFWFYDKALLLYPLKVLRAMQCRAAL